jgi:cyanophycinase-like exopeptidase
MLPRLLVIMGSGETSPTMTKVHRDLFARLGPAPVAAAVLDTPYGFQENADEISARALAYFERSVQREAFVASFRSAADGDVVAFETMVAALRRAAYVFAGPGSPSYALSQWTGTEVPAVFVDKLRHGGCLVFASAAAVTLGPFALPVYEIYKVGQAPHWLQGLDMMAEVGLPAVVVPHFNNAEGGNHDTRYCYMGERRLVVLEQMLPDGVFLLGVDEHTACIFDLDAGTATVAGLGAVTVRRQGATSTLATGQTVAISDMAEAATDGADARRADVDSRPGDGARPNGGADVDSSLGAGAARCARQFDAALAANDARGAVRAALELDTLVVEWSRDTLQSDEADRGRAVLRTMIARLGEVAEEGLGDPRQAVGPFVEALLESRRRARADRRWADADAVRTRLVEAGVEVRDTEEGTSWSLR